MHADFEPIAGVVRVFAAGRGYGDPYTWSGTARFIDRRTVEIVGVMAAPSPAQWRAIKRALAAAGAETAIFRRRKDGRERAKRIDLKEK